MIRSSIKVSWKISESSNNNLTHNPKIYIIKKWRIINNFKSLRILRENVKNSLKKKIWKSKNLKYSCKIFLTTLILNLKIQRKKRA